LAVTLHRQGRTQEAERVYRAILKLKPDHFGALHYLGMIASRHGRPQEAEQLIRQALALNPNSAAARNDLGIALAALGRSEEALAAYERAVALDSAFVEARNNLGNTLHALGRSAEAISHFERALAARPEVADIHNNLGNALAAAGRRQDAIASFHKALAVRPDFAEARNNLGFVLAALERPEDAIVEYERAIALKPEYFEARNNLGNVLTLLNRHEDAIPQFEHALKIKPDAPETNNNFGNVLSALKRHSNAEQHYRKAIEAKPDFSEAHNNLGNALSALDRHGEAVQCFEKALELDPAAADAYCNLGNSLAALDRHDEALASYRKALAISPELAEAHAGLGNELRTLGRLDEARKALERAVELAPRRPELHRSLAESKRFTSDDPQLAVLEALGTNKGTISNDERIALHFALGKAYADFGEHEKAFRQLLEGNALKRRQVRYDEPGTFARFDRLKAVFTPELIRQKAGLGDPSELPIFIVGMPRSGTTLVEQIIASHPKVLGAGELENLSKILAKLEQPDRGVSFPEMVQGMAERDLRRVAADYLAALPAAAPPLERITDKMPANFRLVGMAHLAMPKARIIHVRRDPVDTCLSCFSKLFTGQQPFSYDLTELGRYYRAYEALMAHWRRVLPEGAMMEVQYEDLVADFEAQTRRLLTYCGLDWDDRCLMFHKTQRPVRTASMTQVRQPLYGTSVGRWRPYQRMLRPLLDELCLRESEPDNERSGQRECAR
jgi:tetratricopeptide (TPR) repeat protein